MSGEELKWIGIGLTCGVFFGALIGIFVVAMCMAAARRDELKINTEIRP